MSKIVIGHGLTSSSKASLVSYLRKEYKKEGHEIITPDFPYSFIPNSLWDETYKEAVDIPDEDTFLINISTGWLTSVHHINSLEVGMKIGGVAMITPFLDINYDKIKTDFLSTIRELDISNKEIGKLLEYFKISNDGEPNEIKNLVADKQVLALKELICKPMDLGDLIQKASKRVCIGSIKDPYIQRDQVKIIGSAMEAEVYEIEGAGHLTRDYQDKFHIVKEITDKMIYD